MCILLVKRLESVPFCVQHDDKESKFKEQMQKCGKILRGRKDTLAPWFQHCGGERSRPPRRSDASAPRAMRGLRGQR